MVGILLIAHGSLAEGFARSAEMIMGDDFPQYRALCLETGMDIEEYNECFVRAVRELNTGDGVLVLADLFAGTPANVALRNLRKESYEVITGANLAMVIEAISNREDATLEEVKENAMQAARVSMVDIKEKLNIKE